LDVRLNGKQGGGREADTAVAFVRNPREHFSAVQRASRGANQQLRSAVIQIGGAGISDRGIGRLLSVGRKTAATCRRRRTNRQFLGMDSTRRFAFVPSASLASKRDLTLVSAFWHRVCRENPGRVMRTRIRQADGKARLDATREWKDIPAGGTWNAGEIAVHDKLNKQYLVACQVVIHDSIEDLFRAWGTSEERKRHEAASGGTIGLTLFREARPYCCVPVKPNECACPIHFADGCNRETLRRRIRSVHESSGCVHSCLDSEYYQMTESSAERARILLCPPREMTELRGPNGDAPLLHRKACVDGVCRDCGWDDDRKMRRWMPDAPPCLTAANEQEVEWEKMVAIDSEGGADGGGYLASEEEAAAADASGGGSADADESGGFSDHEEADEEEEVDTDGPGGLSDQEEADEEEKEGNETDGRCRKCATWSSACGVCAFSEPAEEDGLPPPGSASGSGSSSHPRRSRARVERFVAEPAKGRGAAGGGNSSDEGEGYEEGTDDGGVDEQKDEEDEEDEGEGGGPMESEDGDPHSGLLTDKEIVAMAKALRFAKNKQRKRKAVRTVRGKQGTFTDSYFEDLENVVLKHSRLCRMTNIHSERLIRLRKDWQIIIETDFSNDFEFRPKDAECCKFYNNASVVPFYVHYTDKDGSRRKEMHIATSSDLRY
jgi:hypothetical protein